MEKDAGAFSYLIAHQGSMFSLKKAGEAQKSYISLFFFKRVFF